MPERTFSSPEYRYGFNGKEKDEEGEWGSLTHYDYGFRIYNPGVGRFLSVDPLTKDYPYYTPYQFAGNMPVWAIDVEGLEPYVMHDGRIIYKVKRDQGFTQIVQDLELYGISMDWKHLRDLPGNDEYSKHITVDRDNPGNSQYRNLNMNEGNVLETGYYFADFVTPLVIDPDEEESDGYGGFVIGLLPNIGSEAFYSPTFGTWLDKQGKLRPQSYNGNQYSGGKNKFGKTTSKVFGAVNYGVGVYNLVEIERQRSEGLMDGRTANSLQLHNTVSTFLPPQYAIPMSIGKEVGERNAEEIEGVVVRMSNWMVKYLRIEKNAKKKASKESTPDNQDP